jgi:hypothetical protein
LSCVGSKIPSTTIAFDRSRGGCGPPPYPPGPPGPPCPPGPPGPPGRSTRSTLASGTSAPSPAVRAWPAASAIESIEATAISPAATPPSTGSSHDLVFRVEPSGEGRDRQPFQLEPAPHRRSTRHTRQRVVIPVRRPHRPHRRSSASRNHGTRRRKGAHDANFRAVVRLAENLGLGIALPVRFGGQSEPRRRSRSCAALALVRQGHQPDAPRVFRPRGDSNRNFAASTPLACPAPPIRTVVSHRNSFHAACASGL